MLGLFVTDIFNIKVDKPKLLALFFNFDDIIGDNK